MAETTETVVFEVDVSGYEKKLAELTKSINGLTDVQAKYREEAKAGNVEAAKNLEQVNVQLKIQKDAYSNAFTVLQKFTATQEKGIDVTNFSNNSIQKNRDLLSQLTAQYKMMDKPTQDATNRIRNLSDTLKEQEGQIGDTRRNVGNYFNEFAKGVPVLGTAVTGIQNMGVAFKGAGGGVQGFSAALATTGLPLFIGAVNLLIDAFRTFQPIADAVEDIMSGIGAAFATSYSEGVKLSKLKRQLADQDRENLVTNATLKGQISDLETQAKNKALADEKRIGLLKSANELRLKQLNIEKESAEKALEIANKEVNQSELSNKNKAAALGGINVLLGIHTGEIKANDEALQKQAEANARVIDLQTAYSQQVTENKNKIDELTESLKRENKQQVKKSENLDDIIRKSKDSEAALKQLRDNRLAQEELASLTGKSMQQIDADFEKALLNDRFLTFKEFIDKEVAKYREGENKKRDAAKETVKTEAQLRQEAFDNVAKSQEEGMKHIGDTTKEIIGMVVQIAQAASEFIGTIGQLLQQESAQNIEALNEQYKAGRITKAQFNAEAKAEKTKAWKEAKAINITMAVMNTANAIMAQIANPTPYVGFVLAAIAAATGAAQIAIIAKQKQPAFAKGIIGLQGAGTETSDSIDAKLSRGESVMTAKATNKYHRELAWMEESVGNKPNYNFSTRRFANGVISVPTDGGFATREIANNTEQAMTMRSAIMEGFINAPQPVVSVKEINRVNVSRNRSVNVSEL